MKALFVADVPLNNPRSGSERVLFEQATGLARKGVAVCALTRRNGAAKVERGTACDGIPETCFGQDPGNPLRFFITGLVRVPRLFDAAVQTGEPTAAVCHHPFTYFFLILSGRLRRLPVVHVFHSPTHQEYQLTHERDGRLTQLLPLLLRKWVETLCHRKATRIMVLSGYMAAKVAALYGIPEERIIINPGGVDLKRFKPPVERIPLKRALGFAEDRLHLLTVRNLEPRMGLDSLLRAMAQLKAQKLPVDLVLGGEGPERSRLEVLIRELNLQGSVALTGFIPAERLPDYYGAADFFVLPTRRLEGFGLVTPEAMACGTPVLGTPVGGTREILSRFDSDFLFAGTAPGDIAAGIRSAAEHYRVASGRYAALRRRCRQFVEQHYSWERHVETLHTTLLEATAI